jgi:hypothetical protein
LALLPVVSGAAAFVMPFVSLMGGAVMLGVRVRRPLHRS